VNAKSNLIQPCSCKVEVNCSVRIEAAQQKQLCPRSTLLRASSALRLSQQDGNQSYSALRVPVCHTALRQQFCFVRKSCWHGLSLPEIMPWSTLCLSIARRYRIHSPTVQGQFLTARSWADKTNSFTFSCRSWNNHTKFSVPISQKAQWRHTSL